VRISGRKIFLWVVLGLLAGLGWAIFQRLDMPGEQAVRKALTQLVPVEVAPVERGPIELRRTFTGTLQARAEAVVAPKVSGRIERLMVDLADPVSRGQVVAVLDDAEYVQEVARAEADLEVARASHVEAQSLLKIAGRDLARIEKLLERGLSSESQRDAAMAEHLAKRAQVEVTNARIARAEADLEAARIRLGYTQVAAGWQRGSERRVVAERFVDEGETVGANGPLLRIVELDPILAVFFVTERDYARLRKGQRAELSTDAFPGEIFEGGIQRIAPVFRESTRQARVELRVMNEQLQLKPGMFVRATVTLDRVEQAVIVPEQALTTRDGRAGIFLVSTDDSTARWHAVEKGIREDGRVQVIGEGLTGNVVILGQQLLDDGTEVRIAGQGGVVTP
jgi:RND family efflux transporter MFP subunit